MVVVDHLLRKEDLVLGRRDAKELLVGARDVLLVQVRRLLALVLVDRVRDHPPHVRALHRDLLVLVRAALLAHDPDLDIVEHRLAALVDVLLRARDVAVGVAGRQQRDQRRLPQVLAQERGLVRDQKVRADPALVVLVAGAEVARAGAR